MQFVAKLRKIDITINDTILWNWSSYKQFSLDKSPKKEASKFQTKVATKKKKQILANISILFTLIEQTQYTTLKIHKFIMDRLPGSSKFPTGGIYWNCLFFWNKN